MRRIGQPVTVVADRAGTPRAIQLGGGLRPVRQVLDRWVETGRWWDGEEPRRFYRLEAGGMFDLSCDPAGQWRVEVVWD